MFNGLTVLKCAEFSNGT